METLAIIAIVLLSVVVFLLLVLIVRTENSGRNLEMKISEKFAAIQSQDYEHTLQLHSLLETKLNAMTEKNERKMEELRILVDRELQKTLSERLGASFGVVVQSLENVQKGLGEMKVLAKDTRELREVLTNVKNRGNFGEVFLGKLLADLLAPGQFLENVEIRSGKRVEFAVKFPGSGNQPVLLPIDSKFPIESYRRLMEAEDKERTEAARKEFYKSLREFAKSISQYIETPITTNFALMFLPTEGLYAEAMRNAELISELREKYGILVVGATTLAALLASLQVGFKTLAIEKRSEEVWNVLSQVKKEFMNFSMVLDKAKHQIGQAESTIDSLITTRMRMMNRALGKVEEPHEESRGKPHSEEDEAAESRSGHAESA